MYQPIDKNRKYYLISYFILFVAIAIGVFSRFKGLGKWPLTVDEYYLTKSIQNILNSGLPEFECGGYYLRGIFLQYITVPFLKIFSNNELAVRLWPVIFNLLGIIPLYLVGKRLGGTILGCFAVILYSLSLWEIEFARFARMYTLFQTIFLCYLFFFYRCLERDRSIDQIAMVSLSLLSLFVYEGAIFLLILNFLPNIINQKNINWQQLVVKIAVFVVGYWYLSIDFRHLGVNQFLPEDIKATASPGILIYPKLLVLDLLADKLWLIIFIIPFITTCYFSYINDKLNLNSSILARFVFFLFFLLSLLNLLGLSIGLLVIALLIGLIRWQELKKTQYILLLIPFLINLIFWSSFSLLTKDISIIRCIEILFNYPDISRMITTPWLKAVPKLSLALGIIIVFGTLYSIIKDVDKRILLLAGIVSIICLIIGTINTTHTSTRYTFFIYPCFLLLILLYLKLFINNFLKNKALYYIIFIAIFMIFVEDYNFYHLLNIDKKEVNYRMIYNHHLASHYYLRYDFRSPAEFINNKINNNDIVISSIMPVEYYLNKLDFSYNNINRHKFRIVSVCNGKKNIWTNANLIYTGNQLKDIISKNHKNNIVTWLVTYQYTVKHCKDFTQNINNEFPPNIVYSSIDKDIIVIKYT